MKQYIAQTSVIVRDYDEAIDFYVNKLGFDLIEDTPDPNPYIPEEGKRWVIVAPTGSEARLLLSKAMGPAQKSRIGDQTAGRVFLYLFTDDFWRDYKSFKANGVRFVEGRGEPRVERYGTVAVFYDVNGNMWDLIQPSE